MPLRVGVFLSDSRLARQLARDATLTVTTPSSLDPSTLDAVVVEASRRRLIGVAYQRQIPCIAVSEWGNELEDAYDAGCDMFVVAPWSADEIAARARALVRRVAASPLPLSTREGEIVMDRAAGVLTVGARQVPLGKRYADLMATIVEGRGNLVPNEHVDLLFEDLAIAPQESRRWYLAHLRRALRAEGLDLIETVPGHGYRLLGVA